MTDKPESLTVEQINTLIDDMMVAHPIYTPLLRVLRNLALAAKEMEEELKIAHRIALEGNPVFQSLRLERDAMREAIKRAVEKLDSAMSWNIINQIRADLSNAIKEGK